MLKRITTTLLEQGGLPLRSLLCKSAPKEQDTCNNDNCNVCCSEGSKRLICRKVTRGGIGYEAQCKECEKDGKISLYHGETSRTLYTRTTEHLRNERDQDSTTEGRALLKHMAVFHPGEEPSFDIRAVGFFKEPLTRQINEGVRINNTKAHAGYLMNSKSEHRQGEVPRVIMTRGLHN